MAASWRRLGAPLLRVEGACYDHVAKRVTRMGGPTLKFREEQLASRRKFPRQSLSSLSHDDFDRPRHEPIHRPLSQLSRRRQYRKNGWRSYCSRCRCRCSQLPIVTAPRPGPIRHDAYPFVAPVPVDQVMTSPDGERAESAYTQDRRLDTSRSRREGVARLPTTESC